MASKNLGTVETGGSPGDPGVGPVHVAARPVVRHSHYAIKDELKKIAVAEMKHAEAIAERLFYLGGVPTTKPDPIFVGETLKEMLTKDLKDEEGAVKLYKQTIEVAEKEGDITTAQLFKKILADEEEHHDFFQGVLEGLK
jgi:bacterioferritin